LINLLSKIGLSVPNRKLVLFALRVLK
jgi:hypothetical protein